MRAYKCLNKSRFSKGNYALVTIRDEDRYAILNWRNTQIDILRQQAPLTKEQQDQYFNNTVAQLFEEEKPKQILFSFLLNDKLIGYGGLVHIDWENKTAEISFLTETERNHSPEIFISDWVNYLSILKTVAKKELHFHSIFTYAYDIRPNLYVALEKSGFRETKRIKDFIEINNEWKDVVIHTFFFDHLKMRMATLADTDLYYKWANDPLVRNNSYQKEEIDYHQHINWFTRKLNSSDCFFYLFLNEENIPAGQVRIDKTNDEVIIGISIDERFRGKGLGAEMLERSCEDYLSKFPGTEIIAYIKKENTASVNQFSKAGFVNTGETMINECESFRFIKKK